jgi:glycosyltransferase involved in cell wall biosynthesis
VRLVEHDVNLGAVRTFNDGLALITGDYVVRLDADDLLTPGSLARAAAVMEATPSVGLVYGHPLHFTHALPRPRQTPRRWTVWSGAEWLRQRCRTGVNVITAPEVMMRRTVVDDVGGQRDLTHSHDMEMWLRIASVSDVAFIHGVDQAWHRKHGASLSQSVDPDFGGMNDRLEAFVELLSSPDRPIAAAAELRAMAQNALSEEALGRIIRLYDLGRHGTQVETELWRFADGLSGDGLPSARRRRAERLRESGSRSRLSVRLLRRGVIRVRTQREFARWRRKGVFHRDQI